MLASVQEHTRSEIEGREQIEGKKESHTISDLARQARHFALKSLNFVRSNKIGRTGSLSDDSAEA